MIDEASATGLSFNADIVKQVKPDLYDTMHDSCDGIFNVLPTQPRSVADMTTQPTLFHSSALARQKTPPITQSPYRKARLLTPPMPLVLDISARLPWNETGSMVQRRHLLYLQCQRENGRTHRSLKLDGPRGQPFSTRRIGLHGRHSAGQAGNLVWQALQQQQRELLLHSPP